MGMYNHLVRELKEEDVAAFRNFLRVQPELFDELVRRVSDRIAKKETNYRKPIEPACKLAITLRFLATGESYTSLQYGFRVGQSTISKFIPEVCEAIIETYRDEVMACPTTPDKWKMVAKVFADRWNFQHCVGALDGKHIVIRCPRNGGSLYFNYKKFHSIILMALVDGDYKFIWADVGSNGACSDAQIFLDCDLRQHLDNGTLGH